jgi:hypothetical protein
MTPDHPINSTPRSCSRRQVAGVVQGDSTVQPDAMARVQDPEPLSTLAPVCGAFEIRIARDGTWYYHGSPIGRKPLVRLFASVLRRQPDGAFWLVTPYESGRIEVEDAPFVAALCAVDGAGRDQILTFTTNLDETLRADAQHPIIMRGRSDAPAPYVVVRPGLEARIARAVFYQLVDLAAPEAVEGAERLGVWSAGTFFALEPEEEDTR